MSISENLSSSVQNHLTSGLQIFVLLLFLAGIFFHGTFTMTASCLLRLWKDVLVEEDERVWGAQYAHAHPFALCCRCTVQHVQHMHYMHYMHYTHCATYAVYALAEDERLCLVHILPCSFFCPDDFNPCWCRCARGTHGYLGLCTICTPCFLCTICTLCFLCTICTRGRFADLQAVLTLVI